MPPEAMAGPPAALIVKVSVNSDALFQNTFTVQVPWIAAGLPETVSFSLKQ